MNGYATVQREYDMMSDGPSRYDLERENSRLREELDKLKEEYAMLKNYADEVDEKLKLRKKELEAAYAISGMDVKL